MKYIFICGGPISGIGKGTIISSLGVLLKSCGWNVTAIKIDPYLVDIIYTYYLECGCRDNVPL